MEHSMRFAKTVDGLFGHLNDVNIELNKPYRHSYTDWYLIPKERYFVEQPEVKSNIIDVPATNGGLDLSESLTGYPVYSNREGYFEFYVDNDKVLRNYMTGLPGGGIMWQGIETIWYDIHRDICNFLNGRVMYMMLEDDPRLIFHGRFSVGALDASNGNFSSVKISYVLEPFKLLPWRTDNRWYFDCLYTANLDPLTTGLSGYNDKRVLLNPYQDVRVNGTVENPTTIRPRSGDMPTIPTITCELIYQDDEDPEITIEITNESVDINYGHTYKASEMNSSNKTKVVNGITYNVKKFTIYDRKIIFIDLYAPSMVSHNGFSNTPNVLRMQGNGWISLDYDIGVL